MFAVHSAEKKWCTGLESKIDFSFNFTEIWKRNLFMIGAP